jgi:hypothetical protein
MDFNLLGMGLASFDRVLFRGELPARARPPAPGWEGVLEGVGAGARGPGAAGGSCARARARSSAGGAAAVEVDAEQEDGWRRGGGSGRSHSGAVGASGGVVMPTPADPTAVAAAADAADAAAALTAAATGRAGTGAGPAGSPPGMTPAAPPPSGQAGSGPSSLRSNEAEALRRRLEGMLWTRHTAPATWTWAGAGFASGLK